MTKKSKEPKVTDPKITYTDAVVSVTVKVRMYDKTDYENLVRSLTSHEILAILNDTGTVVAVSDLHMMHIEESV